MNNQKTYSTLLRENNVKVSLVKIELLDINEFIIEDISNDLIDCKITITNTNGTRRTAQISLQNIDKKYIPNFRDRMWIDKRIKIYSGSLIDGVEYWQSQGVFIIKEVSPSSEFSNQRVDITLVDKFALLDGTIRGFIRGNYNTDGKFFDGIYGLGNFERGMSTSTPTLPYGWDNTRFLVSCTPTNAPYYNNYAIRLNPQSGTSHFAIEKKIDYLNSVNGNWCYASMMMKCDDVSKFSNFQIRRYDSADTGFLSLVSATPNTNYILVDAIFQYNTNYPYISFGADGNSTTVSNFLIIDNAYFTNLTKSFGTSLPATPTLSWCRLNAVPKTISTIANSVIMSEISDPKPPIIDEQAQRWLVGMDLVKNSGDTFASLFEDLQKRIVSTDYLGKPNGWTYYYDSDGYFHFEPMKDKYITSNDWFFKTEEAQYLGSNMTYSFDKVKNHIYVWGVDRVTGLQVYGEKKDESPQSPTNIGRIGDNVLVINEDLYTQKEVSDRADYELRKNIVFQESISIKTTNIDCLKEDSFILIGDENLNMENDRYWIQSIDMPLYPVSEFTIECWKVRFID